MSIKAQALGIFMQSVGEGMQRALDFQEEKLANGGSKTQPAPQRQLRAQDAEPEKNAQDAEVGPLPELLAEKRTQVGGVKPKEPETTDKEIGERSVTLVEGEGEEAKERQVQATFTRDKGNKLQGRATIDGKSVRLKRLGSGRNERYRIAEAAKLDPETHEWGLASMKVLSSLKEKTGASFAQIKEAGGFESNGQTMGTLRLLGMAGLIQRNDQGEYVATKTGYNFARKKKVREMLAGNVADLGTAANE